jgi:hypothetical protein
LATTFSRGFELISQKNKPPEKIGFSKENINFLEK